jgi:hypothetical protein
MRASGGEPSRPGWSATAVGAPILEHFLQPNSSLPGELIEWLRSVVKPNRDPQPSPICLALRSLISGTGAAIGGILLSPGSLAVGARAPLAIYEEASMAGGVTAFGRCIGHRGMPVELPPKTPLDNFAVEFIDERLYPTMKISSSGTMASRK